MARWRSSFVLIARRANIVFALPHRLPARLTEFATPLRVTGHQKLNS
jgi:hypothetical protein